MIKHLGSKTIGALNIGLSLTMPALLNYLAELLKQKADLVARLRVYADLGVAFVDPTVIAAQLAAALAAFPAQLLTIAKGAIPSIGVAKLAVDADLGVLGLALGPLQLLVDQLGAAVSAGGVHAFSVDGRADSVGSELQGLLAGGMPGGGLPGARVQGVIFLTESPASFSALSKVFFTG